MRTPKYIETRREQVQAIRQLVRTCESANIDLAIQLGAAIGLSELQVLAHLPICSHCGQRIYWVAGVRKDDNGGFQHEGCWRAIPSFLPGGTHYPPGKEPVYRTFKLGSDSNYETQSLT